MTQKFRNVNKYTESLICREVVPQKIRRFMNLTETHKLYNFAVFEIIAVSTKKKPLFHPLRALQVLDLFDRLFSMKKLMSTTTSSLGWSNHTMNSPIGCL